MSHGPFPLVSACDADAPRFGLLSIVWIVIQRFDTSPGVSLHSSTNNDDHCDTSVGADGSTQSGLVSIISRGNAGGRYSTKFGVNYTFSRVCSFDLTSSFTITMVYSHSARIFIRVSLTPSELGKFTLYRIARKYTSFTSGEASRSFGGSGKL